MKKYIAILLFSVFIISGCSNTSDEEEKQLTLSNQVVSIGAAKSQQKSTEVQKLTYEVTIENTDDIRVVDGVDVILSKMIEDRVLEKKNQSIAYKEGSITVKGDIIIDARGLSKKEMDGFQPIVKGVQFIGDNNKEYLIETPSS